MSAEGRSRQRQRRDDAHDKPQEILHLEVCEEIEDPTNMAEPAHDGGRDEHGQSAPEDNA